MRPHLKVIKEMLKNIPSMEYYGSVYNPDYGILYEGNDLAVFYIVRPAKYKKNRQSRARFFQQFDFYLYKDKRVFPQGFDAILGKNKKIDFSVKESEDNIEITVRYVGGRNEERIVNVHLEPDKLLYFAEVKLQILDVNWRTFPKFPPLVKKIMADILLSSFLRKLQKNKRNFGIIGLNWLCENENFKKGFLLFKNSAGGACDVLVKIDKNSLSEKVLVNQITFVGLPDNLDNLKRIKNYFINYAKKNGLRKLQNAANLKWLAKI